MTTEEFKANWNKLNGNGSDLGRGCRADDDRKAYDLLDRIYTGKAVSARQRLMNGYRQMLIISGLGTVFNISLWHELPWYGLLLIFIFFITAGLMDLYLYRGVKSIDPVTDGVEQVAEKARYYRRRHHLFQLVLIPWAVVILAIYFSSFGSDVWMAMTVGGVVGLLIGLLFYFRFMRDYKVLRSR